MFNLATNVIHETSTVELVDLIGKDETDRLVHHPPSDSVSGDHGHAIYLGMSDGVESTDQDHHTSHSNPT